MVSEIPASLSGGSAQNEKEVEGRKSKKETYRKKKLEKEAKRDKSKIVVICQFSYLIEL